MRELKFRGWDGEEMHYPTFCEFGINGVNGKTSISIPLVSGGYVTTCHVMQYTGLKDKNGKEIYEGDILVENTYPFFTDEGCNYMGVVEWSDEGLWAVELHVVSDRVRGGACGDLLAAYSEPEVIGNIYDNPDLTTGGET